MPFVKLDCGILDSTLWIDREARDIFVTALLMAEPFEATEPMPQYEVRSLEQTGFVVPPDWYGFVPAAGIGIIGRAGIDREAGLDALERLGSVDPESRSHKFDGRRLVRVNGGYIVLNFFAYRDQDYTNAERQARFRERQRAKRNGVMSRNNGVTVTDVTQAEAEAEAEAEALKDSCLRQGSSPQGGKSLPPCPVEKIAEEYHRLLPELPSIVVVNKTRRAHVQARWREVCAEDGLDTEGGLEFFRDYFGKIRRSKFLMGKAPATNGRGPFRADFDWIFNPQNFLKIIEGKYDVQDKGKGT